MTEDATQPLEPEKRPQDVPDRVDPQDHGDVTFDAILGVLGEFGPYQKVLYIMFAMPYVETAMQLLGWVFVGATPDHKCFDELSLNSTSDNTTSVNDGFHQSVSTSHGTSENHTTTSFFDNVHNMIASDAIVAYDIDLSHISSSFALDWQLLCQRSGLHATIGASPMLGYLFGGLIFGTLSDRIGRKLTFLLANVLLLLASLGGAVAPDYLTFTASRFLVGASIAGVEASCFVMGMELVGPSKRTQAGILCWFFETAGLLCAVGLAYAVRDNWRLLQTIYSLPAVIFFVYYWLTPESIRWLLRKHRTKEAESIIRTTARYNGTEVPESMLAKLLELSEEEAKKGKTYTVLDLFRTPNLRIKSLVLAFVWTVCSSLYYVLLLDQSELSTDPYLGFVLTALVQLPGYFYVIFSLEHPNFGRKRSMCAFLLLSGLCLCLHPLVETRGLKVAISIFGRFCANCSYTILNLFSAEQFPTVVRGIGVGFALVVSRIGTILGPYLLLLGNYAPIFFGIAALLAGIFSLILPETLGKPMLETIEDGEALGLASLKPFKSKPSDHRNSDV